MPAKETHTPIRNIRVPEDVWRAAQDGAAREGKTVSSVIVEFLRDTFVGDWASDCPYCSVKSLVLVEHVVGSDEWFYPEHNHRGVRCRGAGMRYVEP